MASRYFSLIIFFCLVMLAYASKVKFQDVRVMPGDTLWGISNKYLKDPRRWPEILKYNKLPSNNPSIALPGMILKVPVKLIKEEYRAAKLISYSNRVLFRRRSAAAWKDVFKNMDLYKDDTIRTGNDSLANIRFYTGERLNIYPNSMAVLRPPRKKDADVHLLSGGVRTERATVVTASAKIIPKTRNTEFGAMVKDDLTTLVQVYKGKAQVEAAGKSVTVPAGFASEVKFERPPSAPVKLPPSPELSFNPKLKKSSVNVPKVRMKGSRISVKVSRNRLKPKNVNTNVNMNLDSKEMKSLKVKDVITIPNPVQAYHIQLAKDPNFANIVYDKKHDVFEEVDLREMVPKGVYWIRISYIDLLGFEGKFNKPTRITVK